MKTKARKITSLFMALAIVLGLFAGMPLTASAAGGYTIQNTDDADPTLSGIYSWQQWIASPPTLVDGDAITITATNGPAGPVHFNFPGTASVTGLAGTTYNNVQITANGNLTINDLKISAPNVPALTISTAATLTVTGACEVTSALGSAMQAIGDLIIGGAGTLTVNGGNALICEGNLTVNANVTATNTSDGGTNAGVVFNNSATLSGSGTLNATSLAGSNGGSGIRFNGSSLTVNGPTNLTIEGKDFGKGIYTEAVNPTITINRATATNITGGAKGQGIEHFKSATGGTLTIANNGAGDVNISGGATNGFGLQSNAAGLAFTGTGTGKINVSCAVGTGIYVAANNNFDITFNRGADTNITGGTGISHGSNTLTINNSGAGNANITGSDSVGIRVSSSGSSLVLSGGGPINAKGLINGIYCDGNLTVSTNVNAQHTGDNVNYAGIQLAGATTTLSGSGTLSATSAAANGSGLRFSGDLSISGLSSLTVTGAGYGAGIFGYGTAQTISFSLTNPTTITGGANGHGIGGSAQTIINNGGAVNFSSGGSGGAGIYHAGNLTLGGTGAINATGAGDGIFVSANNITLSGSGAISATSTGTDPGNRGVFIYAPGAVQFDANMDVTLSVTDSASGGQSIIPCSQSGTLTWTVSGDGSIPAGTGTAASTTLTVGTTSKTATIKLAAVGISDDDTIDLADLTGNINKANWSYDNGSRTITVTGNVEVIGTVAGATNELKLNITAGKTVQWKADYSGTVAGGSMVANTGLGTFKVESGRIENSGTAYALSVNGIGLITGGTVKNAAGSAIHVQVNTTVTISGGSVEATGYAIYQSGATTGTVTVTGGTVSNNGGNPTINTAGDVEVSGSGEVKNTGIGNAIYASGTTSTVTVTGGTISAGDGNAIDTSGGVTVSGGTITAGGSSPTIYADGDVEVSQTSPATPTKVENTGGGEAIDTSGDVTVRGGTVTAAGDYTIEASGAIEVSDGTVSNTGTGEAIYSGGGTVTVTGGTVTAIGDNAISASDWVLISGGTVKTEGTGDGIYSGTSDITLSGGYVAAAYINAGGGIVKNGGSDQLYMVTITGLPSSAAGIAYPNPMAQTSGFIMATGKDPNNGYNKAWMPAAASRTYTINVSGTTYTATGAITAAGPNTLNFTVTSTGNVCQIVGGDSFTTFKAAVDAAATGDTITMLKNYVETQPIVISGKTVNLNVGSYTLNLNTTGTALHVNTNGKLLQTAGGTGKFNITGVDFGVFVRNGAEARITGDVKATDNSSVGVYAEDANVTVTVTGDITGHAYGADARNGAEVTIIGNVTGTNDTGAYARGTDAVVDITGKVTGDYIGVDAGNSAVVTVTGNVTATGAGGIGVYVDGSTVTVNGNISADEPNSTGLYVRGTSGTAEIYGNISASFEGVSWFNQTANNNNIIITVDGNITVSGNVSGPTRLYDVEGVGGNTGTCTVTGNVTVYGGEAPSGGGVTGVYCNGGMVTVNGDVISDWIGAQAPNSAHITIEGTLTALGTPFVIVGGTNKAMSDGVSDAGYIKFTQGSSYVWARAVSTSLTDAQKVALDKAWLTWNAIRNANTAQNNITGNLTQPLPATGPNGSAITWSSNNTAVISNTGAVTRPTNDTTVTLTATITNGTASDTVVFTLVVKGTGGGNTAPTLSGPTAMTLTVGYAATSTGAYTIGGSPAPTVTKTSGDAKITWNSSTKKLDIATGLAVGSYSVVLTASNGTLPNATLTFTLTVQSGGSTGGGGGGGGSTATNASITPTKADFDKNGSKDISITLSKGSHTLQSLKNGSYTLKKGTDYTISGNTVTVKAAYLNTLATGSQTITFDMNGGTDPKLTVTVKDTTKTEAWKNPFTDVKEGAWYFDAVKYVYENGLIIGTAADKFSPDSTLTRAMIVTILYRLAGEPDVSSLKNPFDDVAAGLWYTDAIKWAADNGIVAGYGNGKFGPNDPVTKEQLAVIIHRLQQATGEKPANVTGKIFTDIDKVSDWAKDAVNALNNQGIFNDIPGNNFNPQAPATRAEVASMLYRYLTAVE